MGSGQGTPPPEDREELLGEGGTTPADFRGPRQQLGPQREPCSSEREPWPSLSPDASQLLAGKVEG